MYGVVVHLCGRLSCATSCTITHVPILIQTGAARNGVSAPLRQQPHADWTGEVKSGVSACACSVRACLEHVCVWSLCQCANHHHPRSGATQPLCILSRGGEAICDSRAWVWSVLLWSVSKTRCGLVTDYSVRAASFFFLLAG